MRGSKIYTFMMKILKIYREIELVPEKKKTTPLIPSLLLAWFLFLNLKIIFTVGILVTKQQQLSQEPASLSSGTSAWP